MTAPTAPPGAPGADNDAGRAPGALRPISSGEPGGPDAAGAQRRGGRLGRVGRRFTRDGRGEAVRTLVGALASLLCASALHPLFEGFWWWFIPVLTATVVVVALGALGRGRRLRLPVTLGLQLLGLLEVLTLFCAAEQAFLGIVPSPASISHLGQLIADGRADMARLAAPVPELPGLVVLTVLGTTLVTIAVDVLVAHYGRPTLAGLPLLGLFAVPAAVLPGGVGATAFTLGVLGFLALLLLDGRSAVRRWGQLVTTRGSRRGVRLWMSGLAGRIALAAMILALAVPVLTPSIDGHGLIRHPTASDGDGQDGAPNRREVSQPIAGLTQRLHTNPDQPLMRMTPSDPHNPPQLRLIALEDFDGHTFKLRGLTAPREDRVDRGLPEPDTRMTTTEVRATIAVEDDYADYYLPVPGIPTRITGLSGEWLLDRPTGTIFTTRSSTSGLAYSVDALLPSPTTAELTRTGPIPDEIRHNIELPADLDPRVPELAQTLTAGLATDYDKVRAIQDYLRGDDFTYDLNGAPTTAKGALTEFLFTSRRGYCEQFASAMTVLVRSLGIPARVALGFLPGTRQPDGSFLIRNADAHAWPEVWFPGTGWIPFEPTPRADGTAPPDYAPDTTPQQPSQQPGQDPQQAADEPQTGATPPATSSGPPVPAIGGVEESATLAELVDALHTDPTRPLVHVRPHGAAPAGLRLRLTTLGDFDGAVFRSRPVPDAADPPIGGGLPTVAPGIPTTPLDATISVHPDYQERLLPVIDVPRDVDGLAGDWRVDQASGAIYARDGRTLAGATYTVESEIPAPTVDQVTAPGSVPAQLEPYLALPGGLDQRVRQLAQAIASGEGNAYDRARAIEAYLRGGEYTYDIAAPALGQQTPVSQFLLTTRRGSSEHFATAMAVLARSLGIPSRVVVGFADPVTQPDGSLLFKTGNSHAWTEVWLPAVGWTAFDPTPAHPLDLGTTTWSPGQEAAGEPAAPGTEAAPPTDGQDDGGMPAALRAVALYGCIGLAVLLVLAGPATARRLIRRRRLRGGPVPAAEGSAAAEAGGEAGTRVRAGWAELLDVATDLGIPLRPSDSPRGVAARLGAYLAAGPEADEPRIAQARAAIDRLAWAEERARYAPPGTSLGDAANTVAADVTTAITALLSVAPRSRRLVAQVAPPSVLRRLTRSGGYHPSERDWRPGAPTPEAPTPTPVPVP
ncbi:MAG: hypothetical protein IRZ08_14410, partial [Frankia sp.]|nr:hypothetical protein [Frankia sp.]